MGPWHDGKQTLTNWREFVVDAEGDSTGIPEPRHDRYARVAPSQTRTCMHALCILRSPSSLCTQIFICQQHPRELVLGWRGTLAHCKQGVFAIASYQTANSHLIPWTIPPIHAIRTEGTDQSSQFRGYWLPVHICKPSGLQM